MYTNLTIVIESLFIVSLISVMLFKIRRHKNKVDNVSGWSRDIIQWCWNEASKNGLKEADFWGGLAIDEMKIQVK